MSGKPRQGFARRPPSRFPFSPILRRGDVVFRVVRQLGGGRGAVWDLGETIERGSPNVAPAHRRKHGEAATAVEAASNDKKPRGFSSFRSCLRTFSSSLTGPKPSRSSISNVYGQRNGVAGLGCSRGNERAAAFSIGFSPFDCLRASSSLSLSATTRPSSLFFSSLLNLQHFFFLPKNSKKKKKKTGVRHHAPPRRGCQPSPLSL